MPNYLSNYPVTIEQPVAWGDLDLHGHVNNMWFFRYIENARIAYYEKIGKYDYALIIIEIEKRLFRKRCSAESKHCRKRLSHDRPVGAHYG